MSSFGDYIVFADESGSPTLENPDPTYPIFVLAFVIAKKKTYIEKITPDFQKLKFDFFGHDQIILHEREIRRQTGCFARFQRDSESRVRFLDKINSLVEKAEIHVAVSVSKKLEMQNRVDDAWSPYDIGLAQCMESTAKFLSEVLQLGSTIHVVFESRGAKEDRHLELQFRRVATGGDPYVRDREQMTFFKWVPIFADKRSNSSGLQVADLIARPSGLKILRPTQTNRAFDCFCEKLLGGGITCFP